MFNLFKKLKEWKQMQQKEPELVVKSLGACPKCDSLRISVSMIPIYRNADDEVTDYKASKACLDCGYSWEVKCDDN